MADRVGEQRRNGGLCLCERHGGIGKSLVGVDRRNRGYDYDRKPETSTVGSSRGVVQSRVERWNGGNQII